MKLSREDAIYISNVFEDYFGHLDRIDDYMREQKLASLADLPTNPLFPPEDDLFSDFSMHPNDMDFSVVDIPNSQWETLLNITSTHINGSSPGRNVKLAVMENNTKKFVGFIRLGSPIINCKPRNEMLGQVFTQSKEGASRFNNSSMMGFVIVPAQPFGYNYLGGKLLAAICTSHEVREICNKKYNMNMCLFETTSLYGSSKTMSQYDGMKPFIRYKGLTDSDFIPMMHGQEYDDLVAYVKERVGPIVDEDASSKKLKTTMRIIALVKSALKNDKVALAAFSGVLAAPIIQISPLMGSNLIITIFAIVVIGGMGSIMGSIFTGLGLGIIEAITKVIYPEASSTVVFLVMALVLLVRPAGLFGREK